MGTNDLVPQDFLKKILEKYPLAYLDEHPDCDTFYKLAKNRNDLTKSQDETLILVHSPNKPGATEEQISELSNCIIFKTVPKVMLLQNPHNDVIKYCYNNHVSGVVLLDGNETNLTASLHNIFNFWLNIATLPKNMYAVADKQSVDNLSIEGE